jgi:hypothetical protein
VATSIDILERSRRSAGKLDSTGHADKVDEEGARRASPSSPALSRFVEISLVSLLTID